MVKGGISELPARHAPATGVVVTARSSVSAASCPAPQPETWARSLLALGLSGRTRSPRLRSCSRPSWSSPDVLRGPAEPRDLSTPALCSGHRGELPPDISSFKFKSCCRQRRLSHTASPKHLSPSKSPVAPRCRRPAPNS